MSKLIGPVAVIVAVVVVISLVLAGWSWDAPAVNEVGLSYSGGPIEGQHFQGIKEPGSPGSFQGIFDKLVKLPANQRTYIVSQNASESDTGVDFIAAKNSEGVEVHYQTTMWFELNEDPEVLKDFYENICTKYQDCNLNSETGWDRMLNDNLGKAQETALQYESRRATTDDLVKDAGALSSIQQSVAKVLQTKINENLGGKYFVNVRFQINEVQVPQRVSDGYNNVKAAELATETKKQEVNQAEQQALAAEKLQEAVEDNPGYIALKELDVKQSAVDKGQVEFWIIPEDSNITLPSK